MKSSKFRGLGPFREGGGAVVANPSFHTHKIEKKVVDKIKTKTFESIVFIAILVNVNYVN